MGWFRKRDRAKVTGSADYGEAYDKRPIAPPESIYPLINQGLDLAFTFRELGTRFTSGHSRDPSDVSSFMEQWQKKVSGFQSDHANLQNAVRALGSVRMDGSELIMMKVQMCTESWLSDMYNYFYQEAMAYQMTIKGEKKRFLMYQEGAEEIERSAMVMKKKLATVLRELRDEKPEQFMALGISENNLIDIGFGSVDASEALSE